MRALPFLLCLAAVLLHSIMNAVVKSLAGPYDALQVSFLRYVFGTVWILGLVAWQRPRMPQRRDLPLHLLRGALGAVSGTTFFLAVQALSLADAFTISFLAPLFVTLLSLLFLKEMPRGIDLIALALGFGGMLVIVSGADSSGSARSLFGIACAAISAIAYALSLVLLRKLAQRDSYVTLVLFQHVTSAVLLAPFGVAVWVPPQPLHLLAFALIAGLGVAGHLMMARAYAKAPAARLAPLEYSALLYAIAIDFLWFGQSLVRDTVIGAGAIILGAVLASRR